MEGPRSNQKATIRALLLTKCGLIFFGTVISAIIENLLNRASVSSVVSFLDNASHLGHE
uniref:Uncharacterized protein n=1 Tax=Anguilla anguilla TaxID=7936 RepID=A0A0E9TSS3_ANGAN